eukprot:2431903-Amphidinium_carterae.1
MVAKPSTPDSKSGALHSHTQIHDVKYIRSIEYSAPLKVRKHSDSAHLEAQTQPQPFQPPPTMSFLSLFSRFLL